jgi:hypothetical protein
MATGQGYVLPLLSAAEADSLPVVPWSLVDVGEGGRQVKMVISYSGGTWPVGAEVAESPTVVTLTVRSPRLSPGTPVRPYFKVALFEVRLPTALGKRKLSGFSGRTSWPLPIVKGRPGSST